MSDAQVCFPFSKSYPPGQYQIGMQVTWTGKEAMIDGPSVTSCAPKPEPETHVTTFSYDGSNFGGVLIGILLVVAFFKCLSLLRSHSDLPAPCVDDLESFDDEDDEADDEETDA